MTKSEVILSLTKEEAVILSYWLYRNSRKNEYFADLAEQTVFWNIECLLEKNLDVQDTSPKAVEEAKQHIISE